MCGGACGPTEHCDAFSVSRVEKGKKKRKRKDTTSDHKGHKGPHKTKRTNHTGQQSTTKDHKEGLPRRCKKTQTTTRIANNH